jgi:hypothetical protein
MLQLLVAQDYLHEMNTPEYTPSRYIARTGSDTKLSFSTMAAALGISAATVSSNRSVLPLCCSEQQCDSRTPHGSVLGSQLTNHQNTMHLRHILLFQAMK